MKKKRKLQVAGHSASASLSENLNFGVTVTVDSGWNLNRRDSDGLQVGVLATWTRTCLRLPVGRLRLTVTGRLATPSRWKTPSWTRTRSGSASGQRQWHSGESKPATGSEPSSGFTASGIQVTSASLSVLAS